MQCKEITNAVYVAITGFVNTNFHLPTRSRFSAVESYWAIAGSGILTHTITNKRLAQAGYISILDRYESLHSCD